MPEGCARRRETVDRARGPGNQGESRQGSHDGHRAADVGAGLHPLEVHTSKIAIRTGARRLHVGRDRGDAEHAATGRPDRAVGVARGSGLEAQHILVERLEPGDRVAAAHVAGIAGGCGDHAHGGAAHRACDAGFDLAPGAGGEQVQQRLVELVAQVPGFADLAEVGRFDTLEGVRADPDGYSQAMRGAFATRTVDEWLGLLLEKGIPASLLNSIDQAMDQLGRALEVVSTKAA